MSPSKYPQYQWLFKANSESIVSSVQQWLPRFPRRWEAGAKPNPFCSVQKRINGILYIYIYYIYTCTVCIVYIYICICICICYIEFFYTAVSFHGAFTCLNRWIVQFRSFFAQSAVQLHWDRVTEFPSSRHTLEGVRREVSPGVFFPPKWCDGSGRSSGGTKFFIGFQDSTWHFTVTMNGWFCQAILKHPKELRFSSCSCFLWWKWRFWSFRVSDPRGPGLPESPGAAVCRICWTRMSSDRTVMRLLGSCGITPQHPGFISGNHGTIWRKLWCGW